jgi:hypothetical protein
VTIDVLISGVAMAVSLYSLSWAWRTRRYRRRIEVAQAATRALRGEL